MRETARRWLPVAIVLTGVGYLVAAPSEPLALRLAFKVLPMVLIVAYAVTLLPTDVRRVHGLILVGLGFSAVGDVTLHWFLVGLTAFLVAHCCYLAGFLTRVRPTPTRAGWAVPLALVGLLVGWRLLTAIQADGETLLLVPVALYVVVILSMAWVAILTGNRWAGAGSVLFVTSDAILAWDMFVETLPYAGTAVMTTYYAAQLLIARSVADFD